MSGAASASAETLRFKVYLDDDPIGEHSFQVSPRGQEEQVLSRARFDVEVLIFTAYRYRHESRELWRDGCLERIQASTDDNGTDFAVDGRRVGGALAVEINGQPERLPACVSTFAYWDRDLLERPRLLNPQTGELVKARLEPEGKDRRVYRGREVQADRYRLKADELDITLWYTSNGDWIGLESDTGKGRTLRYERL
jgi:hypothetical protein